MTQLALPRTFPFDGSTPYCVEPMRVSDLDQVMEIENAAFPAPWPASAYRYELTQNDLSTYLVLRQRRSIGMPGWVGLTRLWRGRKTVVLAFGGFWAIVDEAHISTIAVHPDWRGRSLGEMMLVGLIEAAILRGAAEVTLEVRVSNTVAQNLYRKYSFVDAGRRRRYYHDNDEDALIMTLTKVNSAEYRARYVGLKMSLRGALARRSAQPAGKEGTRAREDLVG